MKKVIVTLAIVLLISTFVVQAEYYALYATITFIDYEEDVFFVVDENGEEWELTECLHQQVGDECVLLLNDNGTIEIHDDIVLVCLRVLTRV